MAIQLAEDQFPWEQRPEESPQAYAAFLIYLKQDRRTRSVLTAYREYSKRPKARAPAGTLSQWSRDYKWADRAGAWDKHIDIQDLARLQAEILEWRANRRAMLHGAFGKIAEYVDGLDPRKKKANASQISQMVQMIVEQLRKEYEAGTEGSDTDAAMPTIVFANVNMDGYAARANEESEVIEGTAIEIEEG